nr:DUF2933 domain-containing protein [Lysobacter sp. ESA13C]
MISINTARTGRTTIQPIRMRNGVVMATPSAPIGKRIWRAAAFTIAVMAVYYLLTRHAAHAFGVLPYLLILACPLMHLFGHRRHGKPEHRDSGNHKQ